MNGSLTADIAELRAQVARLDDAGQRVFMQELNIQTHASLSRHLNEHEQTLEKIQQMHNALFNEDTGLVHLRKWLAKTAKLISAFIGILFTGLVGLSVIGHNVGWW